MAKANKNKSDKAKSNQGLEFNFVFGRKNYMFMLIGIAVIIVGFALMYGTDNIYDFRKTTLAPIVVITGFVIEIFAIMVKPDDLDESN